MADGILEFTFKPVPNKKPAITAFTVLLALGATAAFASILAQSFKGLISMVAVVFLCAAVYIFTRYIAAEYAYVVACRGQEGPMLIVTKRVGKSVTTLFNMPLYRIQKIEAETAKERRKRKIPAGTQHFNYTVTLFAPSGYRIYAKSRYASSEILIEGTKQLADRLMEYAEIAASLEAAEGDY